MLRSFEAFGVFLDPDDVLFPESAVSFLLGAYLLALLFLLLYIYIFFELSVGYPKVLFG